MVPAGELRNQTDPMDTETDTIKHRPPVRQFSILLQNRVGALASLVRMLRGAKIDVIGLSVQDSRDATVARMVVTDRYKNIRQFMSNFVSMISQLTN